MGDFNSIHERSRKVEGRQDHFLATTIAFKNFIHSNALIDIGFFGPKYTWSNCRQRQEHILERLDCTGKYEMV